MRYEGVSAIDRLDRFLWTDKTEAGNQLTLSVANILNVGNPPYLLPAMPMCEIKNEGCGRLATRCGLSISVTGGAICRLRVADHDQIRSITGRR